MRFTTAIDRFIADRSSQGRINSPATERDYRATLMAHAEDVDNRDPRKTGRDDVKATLRRWVNPNSCGKNRSILVSFYDWTVEEGLRETNPARQTPAPRRRKPARPRLTRDEVQALMRACQTKRERWAINLGLLTGARRAELLGFQGRHFRRPDLIHFSADITKGGKERWVPVLPELQPLITELQQLEDDDYVFCAQRFRDPGVNQDKADKRKVPASPQVIWRLVKDVAKRAGIRHPVTPHALRHAFADYIAEASGDVRIAQLLLGHAELGTTQTYLGEPSLERLLLAVQGLRFQLSDTLSPANPVEAPTGIEPVEDLLRQLEPNLLLFEAKVRLYAEHFREAGRGDMRQ